MATMLMVPVTRIQNLREHPNAAMLGLADVGGYQTVIGFVEDPNGPIRRWFLKDKRDEKGKRIPVSKDFSVAPDALSLSPLNSAFVEPKLYFEEGGERKYILDLSIIEEVRFSFRYKEGDLIVYIPADTVLPDEWAAKLDVKSLLKGGNRVGKIALRGEPSYGIVTAIPTEKAVEWKEGDNVASYYGITKWEPPVKTTAGDAAKYDSDIDPYFDKFTDIQNGRIFVDVFKPGEEVVVSEKLHGTNCRLGYINGHQVAGSMEIRRKRPMVLVNGVESVADYDDQQFKTNIYWFPWSHEGLREYLEFSSRYAGVNTVELFCEVYGSPVQKGFKYDAKEGGLGFRAFGVKVNDKFLDWDDFSADCTKFGIPIVPISYQGPFDMAKVLELSDMPSALGNTPVVDGIQIREGVVVVPARERTDPKVGRACLKYIGYKYDLLKNKPDCKDV